MIINLLFFEVVVVVVVVVAKVPQRRPLFRGSCNSSDLQKVDDHWGSDVFQNKYLSNTNYYNIPRYIKERKVIVMKFN